MKKHLNRLLSLGLILTLGFLLGGLGFSIWDKPSTSLEAIAWSPQVEWIAASVPSYRFYARRTFNVPDMVKGGWLRLSADNDFTLYVNGRVVAQEVSTLRNTLGLGTQVGDLFQRLNDFLPYPSLRAEWVYLGSPKDWKLTSYIDLTRYLQPGRNVIAVEIQKAQKSPRLLLEGAVYPEKEESAINLSTGFTSWKVATLFQTRQRTPWFDLNFPDEGWPEAKAIGHPREATYSRLSQNIFTQTLAGTWIGGNESLNGEVWLRGYWQIPKKGKRSFIRWAGKSEYALLINGLLVNHYQWENGNALHIHEVTNFLHPGVNTLAVRLARPLDRDWHSSFNGPLQENALLGFFLDGWVETNGGEIVAQIATDSTWNSLDKPISAWSSKASQVQSAILQQTPEPHKFSRSYEGNAYLLNYPDYLWHQSLCCFAGVSFILIYASVLGWLWRNCEDNWWNSLGTGAGLLLPGTLFLIGTSLLKHRYAISERWLLFAQPHSNFIILLTFVGIVLLTLLWSPIESNNSERTTKPLRVLTTWALWFLVGLTICVGFTLALANSNSLWSLSILLAFLGLMLTVIFTLMWKQVGSYINRSFVIVQQAWPSWGHWLCLAAIMIVGFMARAYDIDAMDLEADENTSLDATRGILRTGAPIATSGIWYTRGPLYHYILALWLRWVGDSIVNARFLSVLWGTATLFLVFILTRKVTGKVWLALVVTAILAIDPWELWYSRFIRFYQILQFTVILEFWLLLKGFINKEGKVYQYFFYIVLTAILLIQEGSLTLLPGFFLGFLFFYRPFRLPTDWSVVVGSTMVLLIYAFDIIFFSIKCLTPLVALSTSTDSYLKPRLSDVTGFLTNFFIGPNWTNIIYSFLFFVGFIYFLKIRDKTIIFLFSTIALNLFFQTILVYVIAGRYFYPIYPIFIMLSVYSAFCIVDCICRRIQFSLINWRPVRRMAFVLMTLILLANLEVEKVFNAYRDAIAIRNTDIAEYVQIHKNPGDIVISNTSAVYAIRGGLDYYIPHRLSIFDAVYAKEGVVIDRWGGGKLLTNLDQLNHVLENADHVWIHMFDRVQPPKDLEYNEIFSFHQSLGQPVFETFGARLWLWRKEDGLLPRVPNEGKDLGSY